jgi:hypothetical protein
MAPAPQIAVLTPFELGGDEGARTLDLRVANATLYQLSYVPTRAEDSRDRGSRREELDRS